MRWVMLVYKVPREPTSSRVYVWRKLKQLGAVALQDATWILPATTKTQEQFQWLVTEILELEGEALLFQSDLIFAGGGSSLREQFEAPVLAEYEEILAALKKKKPDMAALAKRYQRIKEQDYFYCKLGDRVRQKLLAARGDK